VTATKTNLCRCGQPITDNAAICRDDTDDLARDLRLTGGWWETDPTSPIGRRWLPGLLHDLLTTGTRMDVAPRTAPDTAHEDGHTLDARYSVVISEAASPAHLAALTAYRDLRMVVARGAGNLAHHVEDRPVRGHVCLWLTEHLDTIRRHPWAADLADALHPAVDRAMRIIDAARSPFTIACTCGARVPIDPSSQALIRCPCGQWGTLQWWVDTHAPADQTEPMPLAELHTWLVTRGQAVRLEAVRQWTKRARPDGTYHLPDVGRDTKGRRLYDPTAALDLAQRMTASRAR
jgi:hypothetical protein